MTVCAGTIADNRAADVSTLRDLDARWSKSAQAHDLEATVTLYSDDAHVLPPDAPQPDGSGKVCADIWSPDAAPAPTPVAASGK